MRDSIPLHPKYGLNPTMPQCVVCGKDKGEIALLGNHYKEQAPMKMVLDCEPCKECKAKYLTVGTLLLGAVKSYVGGREKTDLTGDLMVLKDEAFEGIFNKKPQCAKWADRITLYLSPLAMKRLRRSGVAQVQHNHQWFEIRTKKLPRLFDESGKPVSLSTIKYLIKGKK